MAAAWARVTLPSSLDRKAFTRFFSRGNRFEAIYPLQRISGVIIAVLFQTSQVFFIRHQKVLASLPLPSLAAGLPALPLLLWSLFVHLPRDISE